MAAPMKMDFRKALMTGVDETSEPFQIQNLIKKARIEKARTEKACVEKLRIEKALAKKALIEKARIENARIFEKLVEKHIQMETPTKYWAHEETRVSKDLEAKNIFNIFPREIRDMIWRYLFVRPATVSPGYIKYNENTPRSPIKDGVARFAWVQATHSHYGYQWDECRQFTEQDHPWPQNFWKWTPEYPSGYLGNHPQDLIITMPTWPTREQKRCIAQNQEISTTFNDGSQVGCEVLWRGEAGDRFPQVFNHFRLDVHGFEGLAMMRVNQQAHLECTEILYGENTFAFSAFRTSGGANLYRKGVLEDKPELIPGLVVNGIPMTNDQSNWAVKHLFERRTCPPQFVEQDPMLQFLRRIGPANASMLKKIKIEGMMKTPKHLRPTTPDNSTLLGLPRILPIFTTVLQRACPRLRVLTLHIETFSELKQYELMRRGNGRWEFDPRNAAEQSDEERLDEELKKLVGSLSNLRELNLGFFQSRESLKKRARESVSASSSVPAPTLQDEWGKAARWIQIVTRGHVQKILEEEGELSMDQPWADTCTELPTPAAEHGKAAHCAECTRRRQERRQGLKPSFWGWAGY